MTFFSKSFTLIASGLASGTGSLTALVYLDMIGGGSIGAER
jgi:hypothetical protein